MASQTPSTDLRAFLMSDSNVKKMVGNRIHQNDVPAPILPYIFFALSDHTSEGSLGDAVGLDPFTWSYDIECWGQSITAAEDLEIYVREKLNHARGAFGDGTVQGVFVTGQPSDYIPKGIGSGSGHHGHNLFVTIMGWVA